MIPARSLRPTTVLTAALLALGATDAVAQNLPAGHVPIQQPAAQEGPGVIVLETMNSGGYTYVRGEMDGAETWFAGPAAPLQVGDTVLVSDPMQMTNFTSGSLGRTFDVLYFVGSYAKRRAATASSADAYSGSQGAVREILESGGYTYVRVESEGASIWLAGPPTDVSEGQVVTWPSSSMTMRDFSSRTLGRTFEEILFVSEIRVVR